MGTSGLLVLSQDSLAGEVDTGAAEAAVGTAAGLLLPRFEALAAQLVGTLPRPVVLLVDRRLADEIYPREQIRRDHGFSERQNLPEVVAIGISFVASRRVSAMLREQVNPSEVSLAEGGHFIALCVPRLASAASACQADWATATTVVLAHELVHWYRGAGQPLSRGIEEATAQLVTAEILRRDPDRARAETLLRFQRDLAQRQPSMYRTYKEVGTTLRAETDEEVTQRTVDELTAIGRRKISFPKP